MKTRLFALFLPLLLTTGLAFAQGAKTDDIPLPSDPPVPAVTQPPIEQPAGAKPAAKGAEDDIPLPDDPSVSQASAAPNEDPGNHNNVVSGTFLGPDFMRAALVGGILVAIVCSYLGLFVVARRMVFVGVALAQLSSAGIALTMLLEGFSIVMKPLYGALLCMFLGVILFSRRWAPRRVPNDGVIAIFYLGAMAIGTLMLAKSPHGEALATKDLEGEMLTVAWPEVIEMAAVFAVIGIFHWLFAKELMLVSMDRDTAGTQGIAAARWDFALFLTIGIAVALAIRSSGVLMTSALLILPAATALLIVSRWWQAAILAPIFGVVAVVGGLYLSYAKDVPSSAAIAALSVVMLLPALVWRSWKQT